MTRASRPMGSALRALLVAVLLAAGLACWPVYAAEAELASASIDFAPGVASQDAEFVTEGVQLALDFFAAEIGPGIQTSLQVRVEATANDEPSLLAYWDGETVVVLTGSPVWQHSAPAERIATIIHELTHVYQTSVLGFDDLSSPAWFEEGIAEFLSYYVLDQLGVLDHDELVAIDMSIASHFARHLSLDTIAGWRSFQQAGADAYSLSHAAVAVLMDGMPLSVVGLYYSMLGQGYEVDQAFAILFGATPQGFSEEMDSHLDDWIIPDGLSPHDLMLSPVEHPGPVELTDAPAIVTAGEQFVVVGITEPALTCNLGVKVPGAPAPIVERSTFADRSGDVFWLVTIPPDLADGLVKIEAACGGDIDSRAAILH